MKPRWTQEEKTLLLALVKDNTDKQCAAILKKSVGAVEQERRKLGVSRCRVAYKREIVLASDIEEKLKKLFYKDIDLQQIAKELETTPHQLRKAIKSLGLKRRGIRPKRKMGMHVIYADKIRSLYVEQHKNHEEIANELNISVNQVKYVMARNKISRLEVWYKKWTEEEDASMLKMLDEGMDIDSVSKILNRSDEAIINRVTRALGKTDTYPEVCKRRNKNRNEAYDLPEVINKKLHPARIKCQKRGMTFKIDQKFILDLFKKQDGKCFYTGETLSYKPNTENFFSIDRLDSSKGYIDGNIVLCVSDVNYMKTDLELDRFIKLCHLISNKFKS